MNSPEIAVARWRLRVRGIVQGVGFRPFVHHLAESMALAGWVRNDAAGVLIEIQGAATLLLPFIARLKNEAPRLACIDDVAHENVAVDPVADGGFSIVLSEHAGSLTTMIGVDSAVCDDCLNEMLTPGDRRYRYPFINCTHCGPRYTLVRQLPYDRVATSMAKFSQCPACLSEYRAKENRRYHAEPNACPACGPQLQLWDMHKTSIAGDPIAEAVNALQRGAIVAMKGLGGFHLVCDARNRQAVKTLRQRKARDEKPFAVMMLNSVSARQWCMVSDQEDELLNGIARPIVLLDKKESVNDILPDIAPGMNTLGVMLPYTPMHYLLFHEALGRPTSLAWLRQAHDMLLVMTSANPGGEPLVVDNDEAILRLHHIADLWLVHDRDIVSRCDDSVTRAPEEKPKENTVKRPQFFRRARGYAPQAIRLNCAENAPTILATGAFFKNTVCITRGDEAFLSPHIGSLDNAATRHAFDAMVEHFMQLLAVTPQAVVHDRHPDFYSTHAAAVWAERFSAPLIAVSHHHAHIAAVMAEHHLDDAVLGLAFDGVGLGDDGEAWGGELLRVDQTACARLGHLAPLYLAGGDRAAREPWRMAASVLAQTLSSEDAPNAITTHFAAEKAAPTVATLLMRAKSGKARHTPRTTGMGRMFDAAAAALNICSHMRFEGQAAMQLEGLAHRYLRRHDTLPVKPLYRIDGNLLDIKPLLAALFDIDDAEYGAALFHGTLIAATIEWAAQAAKQERLARIVCGGGCFMNALLAQGVHDGLTHRGFNVYQAQAAPANDGGLSLGQAWIGLHALRNGSQFII